MPNARPLYVTTAGAHRQLQTDDILFANSIDLFTSGSNVIPATVNLFTSASSGSDVTTVNFLTGLTSSVVNFVTNSGSGTINIGTGHTSGSINIGGVGSLLNIGGDLRVAGAETVIGATVFSDMVTFGDGTGTDVVRFRTGTVVGDGTYPGMVFNTAAGPQSISTNGTNALTIETVSSGSLVITSVGTLDINGVATTLDASGGFSIDGAGAASNVSSTSQNLTLSTVTSGSLIMTSASGVDINAGTLVTIDAGTSVSIDATNDSNFTVTSGSLTLTSGSCVDINASTSVSIDAAAASNFTVSSGSLLLNTTASSAAPLNITTSGSNCIVINPGTGSLLVDTTALCVASSTNATSLNTASPTAEYVLTLKGIGAGAGNVEKLVSLINTDGSPVNASIIVSAASPNNVVIAPKGSIALVATGEIYVNTSGSVAWSALGISGASSLQTAYNAGGSIVTAGSVPIDFTLTTGNFEVTAGSGTNSDIIFDNGTNNYLFIDGSTGEMTISSIAQDLNINTTTSGSILIAPAANGGVTIDTTGTGGISLDAGAASNYTVTNAPLTISTTGSGVLTLNSGSGNVDIRTNYASGTVNIDSATSVTVDAATFISLDAALTSNFTVSSGSLLLNTQGVSDANLNITTTGSNGINITTGTTGNLTFGALNSTITLNQTGSSGSALVGFTATSIVGALNELKADAGSGLVSSYPIMNGITIVPGDAIYLEPSGRAHLANSLSTTADKFVGIAKTGGTGDIPGTVSTDVYIGGEASTITIIGTGVSPGKYAYLSATAGTLTVDAPVTGILLCVGLVTGGNKIVIQVGQAVELS